MGHILIPNEGAATYKRYVALLTQTGTNAPVATVLENTLGGTVIYSYVGVGGYFATLTGAFMANKTVLVTGSIHALILFTANRVSNDTIALSTYTEDGITALWASGNDLLSNCSIEIRVYP